MDPNETTPAATPPDQTAPDTNPPSPRDHVYSAALALILCRRAVTPSDQSRAGELVDRLNALDAALVVAGELEA